MSSFPQKKPEIVLKPLKSGLINKINALYYNNNYLGAIWYNKVHLQYGLWNFQTGGTKLERYLPKN